MSDARAEVTSRVDGVTGRTTEAGADADHQEGDGQCAEGGESGGLAGLVTERDHHEDQHEGADDLGDQVPGVAADGRAGGEDTQLVARVRLLVEVLLVRQERQHGADDRTDQLGEDVQDHCHEVDRNQCVRGSAAERLGPVRH